MFKKIENTLKKIFSPRHPLPNIIHNRFVLYFFVFLAVSNLYFLAMTGENTSIAVFILAGFLTSFFSKNMIIVLFVAICLTNVLRFSINHSSISEGFDDEIVPETANKGSDSKKAVTSGDSIKGETKGANEDAADYLAKIKSDAKELLNVQNEIMDNMTKIDPLLSKAEKIIAKFEKYKANNGDKQDKLKKYETDTKQIKN
jgi:hypothetical protein